MDFTTLIIKTATETINLAVPKELTGGRGDVVKVGEPNYLDYYTYQHWSVLEQYPLNVQALILEQISSPVDMQNVGVTYWISHLKKNVYFPYCFAPTVTIDTPEYWTFWESAYGKQQTPLELAVIKMYHNAMSA